MVRLEICSQLVQQHVTYFESESSTIAATGISSYQRFLIGIRYNQNGYRQVENGFRSGISRRIANQSNMTRDPDKNKIETTLFQLM